MNKITFKGFLDGFRSSSNQQALARGGSAAGGSGTLDEIVETLRTENFQVAKTFRHGFPFQPTAVAFDPIQRLLAIGTKTGSLRLLGRPGVDSHSRHESDAAVLQIAFLLNEGALVTATADDSIHLWTFKQKKPEVLHTLKFQRERITSMHLPLQSKWMYVGTDRGNIHVVNIENFRVSGYLINWNKAIEVIRKTHPGPVVHLSDCPTDASKLLIGYETGQLVLWDLRTRAAEFRWQTAEPLRSVAWHHEGKQFMCSHTDGSLTTWMARPSLKPLNHTHPHAKPGKDGKPEACKPIGKVEWLSARSGETYVIFSGGLAYDKAGRTPSITVMHGKSTTVLEMEHNVVDFITLCDSPYNYELQEPYAIVVVLHNDLVVIDLLTQGFPCFENPYPMDIHESPVTCCTYLADCPSDLIPAFYSVGCRAQKRSGFSEREWPLSGGEWSPTSCSYNEIIVTGHADGSIKFWDASAGTLQVLYKLKSNKVFERPRARSVEGSATGDDDPYAVHLLSLCPESRKLCVAGSTHVILFNFRKNEAVSETHCLEIPIVYEAGADDADASPDPECAVYDGSEPDSKKSSLEYTTAMRVRSGQQKKPAGFQAHLVCLTPHVNGEPPGQLTALAINSVYGLIAYGNSCGLVIVDIVQRVCVLSMGTPDIYGNADPYQRAPRSPKRHPGSGALSDTFRETADDRSGSSPTTDQLAVTPGELLPPAGPFSCSVTPRQGTPEGDDDHPDLALLKRRLSNEALPDATTTNPSVARRKSTTWRGLRKQLSRVDARFKNTFSTTNPGCPAKRSSVFYSTSSEMPTSPCDDPEVAESEISAGSDDEHPEGGDPPVRPQDLPLRTRKSGSIAATITSDKARLLSVPNIKLSVHDLRRRGDAAPLQSHGHHGHHGHLLKRFNKLDSSFSRSRSSSMSSLENISSEAIHCLVFADSFTRKSPDATPCPALWVGTSLGSVLTVLIQISGSDSTRATQPLAVQPCGTIFRLKGCIRTIAFLDCTGALMAYQGEPWRDDEKTKTPTKCPNNSRMSPTLSAGGSQDSGGGVGSGGDRQLVVFASEKQARVVALPSHNCIYKQQLADTDFIIRAEIITLKDGVVLACYVSSGYVSVYSLPSLRPLTHTEFLPLSDLSFQTTNKGIVDPMLSIWGQQMFVIEDTDQIGKTFCFSNRGHGLYLCSPTEVQKFTLSSDFCASYSEMAGELFLPHDMPEPPKLSFFSGLFGGGSRSLDREELFGEASGRASRTVAKHIPGPSSKLEELNAQSTTASNEVARARMMMIERGEKLGQLEETSARMMNEAEDFSKTAHNLKLKYKDKKWYQL